MVLFTVVIVLVVVRAQRQVRRAAGAAIRAAVHSRNTYWEAWQSLMASLGGDFDSSVNGWRIERGGMRMLASISFGKSARPNLFKVAAPVEAGSSRLMGMAAAEVLSRRRENADAAELATLPSDSDAKGGAFPWEIKLRCEGGVDLLGKKLRINREVQTGDQAFDRDVYVDTDAPDDVVRRVLSDPELRAVARRLLQRTNVSVTLLTSVGALVERQGPDMASLELEAFRALLDDLKGLAVKMPSQELRAKRPFPISGLGWFSPFFWLAVPASIVWAILGNKWWNTVDWLPVPIRIGAGVLLWLVLVPCLMALVRGRSNSMRRLLIWLGALIIACPFGSTAALMTANGWLDRGPSTTHKLPVGRWWYKSGKKSKTYYVEVRSWRKGEARRKLKVKRHIYNAIVRNRRGSRRASIESPLLRVTIHPGRLGWEWMGGVTLVRP